MSAITYPYRVASLQPSATVTLDRLGLLDRVVACTRYCQDVCPHAGDGTRLIISDSWTAQASQIIGANPDLVIASVPYQLEAVAEILKAGIRFLGLAPRTLADVYSDMLAIAGIMGAGASGERLVSDMQMEIELVRRASTRCNSRPRVFCEEWGKPIIHSQPWVKELVEAAGGEFIGEPGQKTDADAVRTDNPDVIVAAWCGAGNRVPLEKVISERDWIETKAARTRQVFCVSDELLNTPAPTLLDGLRALAWAMEPNRTNQPPGIRQIADSSATPTAQATGPRSC
ncbi:MAG TPA: ABC transporter substrate-binding protein [Clostridia bacterium]|nr:ABC transporter substrate-binding protein [Clostridia bacterium]